MDRYVDERDFNLLSSDKYTFFVLNKVLKTECDVIMSDHEKMIICHTCAPYPVWIWTKDGLSKDDLKKAYDLTDRVFPVSSGYTYNVKYELAEYFVKRASDEGKDLSIKINMFAYDCPKPVRPVDKCDGRLHICTMDDVDEIAGFMDLFHKETQIDRQSIEIYKKRAMETIANNSVYLWKDKEGKSVASCCFRPDGEMGSVGLVYTREEARRKHYAQNLVYSVTEKAKEAGFLPMLYTNADYKASNACYEKIGYILRGKLCTIGAGE